MKSQEKNSLNVKILLDRLKIMLGLKSDLDLATYLSVNPNLLSMWKKRNSADLSLIITKCDVDLNELLKGTSPSEILRAQPSVSESTEPLPPATPPPEPPPGACTGCLLRDKVIASLEKTIASQEKTIATLEDSLKQARQPHGQKRKAG